MLNVPYLYSIHNVLEVLSQGLDDAFGVRIVEPIRVKTGEDLLVGVRTQCQTVELRVSIMLMKLYAI